MSEYIDKKSLLDEICRDNCERSYDGTCHNCRMTETIADFPAADVAPVVHGKWEWVNEDRYRCDRCEQITAVDECMGKPIYNFCPNCGARMDGKEPNNEQSNRNR